MKTQRITLDDIATLAGVTKMTVSRYLRTPEKVKAETAAKIASVMAEIGYVAEQENTAASRHNPSRIGVLIPSFNNQIFADLLAGIESVTSAQVDQTLVVAIDGADLAGPTTIRSVKKSRLPRCWRSTCRD